MSEGLVTTLQSNITPRDSPRQLKTGEGPWDKVALSVVSLQLCLGTMMNTSFSLESNLLSKT